MSKQPKYLVSFVLAFFTSYSVILVLFLTKLLEIESLYGAVITMPFAFLFIYIFYKQIDLVLQSTAGDKKKGVAYLFFIGRIFTLMIPAITFGVLRSKGIWTDALWGAVAIIGALPVGFLFISKLTTKERAEAFEVMKKHYKIEDDKPPSARAKKYLDKLEPKKETSEGGVS